MRKHVTQQMPIFLQPQNSSVLDSLQISVQLLLKLINQRLCNKSLDFKTMLRFFLLHVNRMHIQPEEDMCNYFRFMNQVDFEYNLQQVSK